MAKKRAPDGTTEQRTPSAGADLSHIAESLRPLAVPVADLVLDPANARSHGLRNMEAIKGSLLLYRQQKPIVVRRGSNVVVAGNGTLEAARELGWMHLAVSWTEMEPVEAIGYAIADNRTAELAEWDQERLGEQLAAMHDQAVDLLSLGWSQEELDRLLAPAAQEGGGDGKELPGEFKEMDEDIEVEHVCPRCGYQFSGGETREKAPEGVLEEEA